MLVMSRNASFITICIFQKNVKLLKSLVIFGIDKVLFEELALALSVPPGPATSSLGYCFLGVIIKCVLTIQFANHFLLHTNNICSLFSLVCSEINYF